MTDNARISSQLMYCDVSYGFMDYFEKKNRPINENIFHIIYD